MCARLSDLPLQAMATAATAVALFFMVAGPANAQSYPAKAIRVIVPVSAGSGMDIVGRIAMEKMAQNMGHALVAENIPGANGIIGGAAAARAAPDGYKPMLTTSATNTMLQGGNQPRGREGCRHQAGIAWPRIPETALQRNFYSELPLFTRFAAVTHAENYTEVPAGWWILIGDGAALLVPEAMLPAARKALLGTRLMARESFGLELLIVAVPIEDIRRIGRNVPVAKFGASRNFAQSMFNGGGVAEAERIAKDPGTRARYEITGEDDPAGANFSGLECRWQGTKTNSGRNI